MFDLAAAARRARDLVREGAALAVSMQGRVSVRDKGNGRGPVTDADLAVEQHILAGLAGEPVLSEEAEQEIALPTPLLWCVDPIDGTREYAKGLGEWATQIGVLVDGEPAAGALGLPDGAVYWGWRDGGAFVDRGDGERPVRIADWTELGTATIVMSRRKPSATMRAAVERLGCARRLTAGGCGYKAVMVLRGDAQIYLHAGAGTTWWDTVGPVAVVRAAGGHASRPDGSPLRYAEAVSHPMGFLLSPAGLAPAVVAALA